MIYTSTGTLIELSKAPFAKGGEGQLYHVLSPTNWQNRVAKIYHPNKRTAVRKDKLTYIVQHPLHLDTQNQTSLVAWPLELIYENKQFIGFLMPIAKGELLEVLAAPKLPKKLSKDNKWQRFDLKQSTALELRKKVCFNIAVALQKVHATGKYILVDLKPENVLIQSNGLVSLVDMDSIQIVEDGKHLFSAAVATPEFAPPEFHKVTNSLKISSWDEFSLAVIFYKILLGIHPFAATATGKFEQAVTLGDKIALGLYVHHPDLQKNFQSIPPPHSGFHQLPIPLQHLFNSCFVEGLEDTTLRPSAEDWCLALGGEQINRPYFELPIEQFYHPTPQLPTSPYNQSFENHWLSISSTDLIQQVQKRYEKRQKTAFSIVFFIAFACCVVPLFFSFSLFLLTIAIFFFPLKKLYNRDHQLEYHSEDWWDFHDILQQEKEREFNHQQRAWQLKNTLEQQAIDIQQQQWQKIWLDAEKECLSLNKEKLAELSTLKRALQIDTTWKKYVGKNLFEKLAYLEQQQLPILKANALKEKRRSIQQIEKLQQDDWEKLERNYHQELKIIEQQYSENNAQKIAQKKEAERLFVQQRQVIIETIATQKELIEQQYKTSKKEIQETLQQDKNTLKQLSTKTKEQQKWIELHYQSQFRSLLARLEVLYYQNYPEEK